MGSITASLEHYTPLLTYIQCTGHDTGLCEMLSGTHLCTRTGLCCLVPSKIPWRSSDHTLVWQLREGMSWIQPLHVLRRVAALWTTIVGSAWRGGSLYTFKESRKNCNTLLGFKRWWKLLICMHACGIRTEWFCFVSPCEDKVIWYYPKPRMQKLDTSFHSYVTWMQYACFVSCDMGLTIKKADWIFYWPETIFKGFSADTQDSDEVPHLSDGRHGIRGRWLGQNCGWWAKKCCKVLSTISNLQVRDDLIYAFCILHIPDTRQAVVSWIVLVTSLFQGSLVLGNDWSFQG